MTSLFVSSLCRNSPTSELKVDSWLVHFPVLANEKRIGKQMPPHHEPDAILINVGGSGQPGFPGIPSGDPGIFGIPRIPTQPQFPGINRGPNVFGMPGGAPQIPGGPGIFGPPGQGIPRFPNTFGVPQAHGWSGNPGGPNVYATAGGSGVFLTPGGQGSPLMPNAPGTFGISGAGSGSGFVPEQGGFGIPNNPVHPGGPSFVQPGVFSGAGGGTNPYPGVPGFFFPSGTPNMPEPSGDFPSTRGVEPEAFIPGGVNGFGIGSAFPGVFYPGPSFFPNNPDNSGNPQGNIPRREIHRETGDREVYDDPVVDMFPLIEKPTLRSSVSN